MTNAHGETQWQYQLNGGGWRTFDWKHSRALCIAHAKGQAVVPVVLCGVEYLARLPAVDADDLTCGFMRLESLDLVVAGDSTATAVAQDNLARPSPEAAADVQLLTESEPQAPLSASAQLRQRQRAQKEQLVAEHTRLVLATHAEHKADCQQADQKLQNEDADNKAMRVAMNSQPRVSATHDAGSTNKRSHRLKLGKLYFAGVAAFRSRNPVGAAPPSPPTTSPGSLQDGVSTKVLVRTRPLFEDEAGCGEWDSVSSLPHGIVVHEATEKLKGAALVQVLRHHTFSGNVCAVSTDDELFDSVRYLLHRAAEGGIATLFCYGMTGSGKTYSMSGIHRRMPADLFSLLSAASAADGDNAAAPRDPRSVRFSAFDFLGKRCFELLPADYSAAGGDGRGKEEQQEAMCAQKREVFLRVDGEGATHVCGVAEHIAYDEEGLRQLLRAAVARRETSATSANATSSRTHAVYALQLPSGGRVMLIDLAGSEASQESLFHNKQQISESKEIMNSLAVLRACLRTCSNADARQVLPFRESVLTRVLKDALTDPSAATAVLACVSPACSHTEHSLRTLRTAVYLTGNEAEALEEEEMQLIGVRATEPKMWDHDTLRSWVEEQPFAAQVQLPPTMGGKEIMRLAQNRLAPFCTSDAAVAAELFGALRVVAKKVAADALEQRLKLKR